MVKLVSSKERGKQLKKQIIHNSLSYIDYFTLRDKYDRFLDIKLSDRYDVDGFSAHPLNRFFPCDENGEPIDEPRLYKDWCNGNLHPAVNEANKDLCVEYYKAKERVLFDGEFKYENGRVKVLSINGKVIYIRTSSGKEDWAKETIEDLIPYNLKLTKQVLK